MILHNENREHLSDGESLFELLLLCRIRTFGHRHSVALAAAAVVVGEGTCASNNSMYIVHVPVRTGVQRLRHTCTCTCTYLLCS